jgi:arginyl-tRNA synthetase
MIDPQAALTERFAHAIVSLFGHDYANVDPLIRPAQNPKFGDYQANVAMSLGKQLGRNPREVAQAIADAVDLTGVAEKPDVAGPGFLNLRLTADYLSAQADAMRRDERLGIPAEALPQRIVVDYSGPNVAKEMHVGHIRSTCIGDCFARVFDFLGHTVTRQNHLGDWGTQFGMLIEHLAEGPGAEGRGAGDIAIGDLNAFYQQAKRRFDEEPAFADRARKRVVALQSADPQTRQLWEQLVLESERHFAAIYDRLNVLLTDEDIRGESFYNERLAPTADELEQRGVAKLSDGALCVFVENYEAPLMIRKSDGGFGYDTTDLAAIRYRVNELQAGRIVYVTDARQAEHFAKVFAAAQQAGWVDGVRLDHVPFGTILGEDGKPFKTRSGETVKLAALLDEAVERAKAIVAEKNAELSDEEQAKVARLVGIGAIKYADLSSDRVRDYVFSWQRMLAMDGNTAPYLQYAYARIRSIFRKAEGQGPGAEGLGAIGVDHPAERALVLKLMQFGSVVRSVGDKLEPHHLCTYLYELSTAFNGFYENCPVLKADTDAQRASRLGLCDVTSRTLKRGLGLLGIEVLERM